MRMARFLSFLQQYCSLYFPGNGQKLSARNVGESEADAQ